MTQEQADAELQHVKGEIAKFKTEMFGQVCLLSACGGGISCTCVSALGIV